MSWMQLGIRYLRITKHLEKAVIPRLILFLFSELKIKQERDFYKTNKVIFTRVILAC